MAGSAERLVPAPPSGGPEVGAAPASPNSRFERLTSYLVMPRLCRGILTEQFACQPLPRGNPTGTSRRMLIPRYEDAVNPSAVNCRTAFLLRKVVRRPHPHPLQAPAGDRPARVVHRRGRGQQGWGNL